MIPRFKTSKDIYSTNNIRCSLPVFSVGLNLLRDVVDVVEVLLEAFLGECVVNSKSLVVTRDTG